MCKVVCILTCLSLPSHGLSLRDRTSRSSYSHSKTPFGCCPPVVPHTPQLLWARIDHPFWNHASLSLSYLWKMDCQMESPNGERFRISPMNESIPHTSKIKGPKCRRSNHMAPDGHPQPPVQGPGRVSSLSSNWGSSHLCNNILHKDQGKRAGATTWKGRAHFTRQAEGLEFSLPATALPTGWTCLFPGH